MTTAAAAKLQSAAANLPRPPAEVRPIAAVIGAAATLRLVEEFGGIRLVVPLRVRAGSVLGRAIGVDALRQLVDAYAGNRLNVPLCKEWRAQVLRVRDRLSYSEIARALHITEGTVYRYLDAAGLVGQERLPGL